MMIPFRLITGAEIFAPTPLGRADLLIVDGKIAKIGRIELALLRRLDVDVEHFSADRCIIVPGLVDAHEHLLGGSGEGGGFRTQTPEVFFSELVQAGITTAVGTLGVDTVMKTMPGLLAKVKALREEGLSAFMYTGGYTLPPTTIFKSAREDIMFIDEVIGVGEVAIADYRACEPSLEEFARTITDAYVGGMLAGKAGVTHFHVGEGDDRLRIPRELLRKKSIRPEWLFFTHIQRSRKLIAEAAAIARRGAFVNIDVMTGKLEPTLRQYRDANGPLDQLSVSTDAAIGSPSNLLTQLRACAGKNRRRLASVLPLFTRNPARALKLRRKGEIREGGDADLLVLERADLSLKMVFAQGQRLVRDGSLVARETFMKENQRDFSLSPQKRGEDSS